MSDGAVNGSPASRMRWQLGRHGAWWVDANLTEPDAFAVGSHVTVKLADATGQGTIVSGGAAHGAAGYRIVGGAGGLGRELAANSYVNDVGVKASLVWADALAACGEAAGALPTAILGRHYARAKCLGFEVVNLLAPAAWHVDLAGVVQYGAWPESTYTGDAPRTRVEPAAGVIELATDEIAALLPGVRVDGSGAATDVEWLLDASRITVRIYSRRALSRALDAMRRTFLGLFPEMRYRGLFEYRVTTQTGDRLSLQPARVASGMPVLSRVPVRPGVAGFRSTVKLGELVLVAFADADPSRPNVVNHDAPDAPGWYPELTEFGDGGDFVALKGAVDAIQQSLDQTASWGTPFGPTTPGNLVPVGPQDSAAKLKAAP